MAMQPDIAVIIYAIDANLTNYSRHGNTSFPIIKPQGIRALYERRFRHRRKNVISQLKRVCSHASSFSLCIREQSTTRWASSLQDPFLIQRLFEIPIFLPMSRISSNSRTFV